MASSSVRSTNVYEERSLGIFLEDDLDENEFKAVGSRVTIWSKYLALHARKQLTFGKVKFTAYCRELIAAIDMWWLALALFLICIIEVI